MTIKDAIEMWEIEAKLSADREEEDLTVDDVELFFKCVRNVITEVRGKDEFKEEFVLEESQLVYPYGEYVVYVGYDDCYVKHGALKIMCRYNERYTLFNNIVSQYAVAMVLSDMWRVRNGYVG